MRTILAAELHAEMKAQGAPTREDIAFKCVICGTVQSIRSLKAAGLTLDQAERQIGFSCEGRERGAGPAKDGKPGNPHVRGCDWSLGGLFHLHRLEVTTPDGKTHPTFELATAAETIELMEEMAQVENGKA